MLVKQIINKKSPGDRALYFVKGLEHAFDLIHQAPASRVAAAEHAFQILQVHVAISVLIAELIQHRLDIHTAGFATTELVEDILDIKAVV